MLLGVEMGNVIVEILLEVIKIFEMIVGLNWNGIACEARLPEPYNINIKNNNN